MILIPISSWVCAFPQKSCSCPGWVGLQKQSFVDVVVVEREIERGGREGEGERGGRGRERECDTFVHFEELSPISEFIN